MMEAVKSPVSKAPAAALSPSSVTELVDAIRTTPRLVACGGGTKPRLALGGDEISRISTARLSGIIEYEPSEFTFTALAGTPMQELVHTLAEQGQYLPFDPLLLKAGATLGGTIAAGVNGPGRFRFGGIRDFILGIRFVDGEGRLLRMGGKVVKNAAGFDLPKFFVGSAGRYGVIAEASFKVFPRPLAWRTLRFDAKDVAAKLNLFAELGGGRWEIDALDTAMEEPAVFARIGGSVQAVDAIVNDLIARRRGTIMSPAAADALWQTVSEFSWAHEGGTLVKVALSPAQLEAFVALVRSQAGAHAWVSVAGAVAYLSMPAGAPIVDLPWPGMTLRGNAELWVGPRQRDAVMERVKAALDPNNRFPSIDE